MSVKPKSKDKNKKWLERIAGRPALGPPPTARPLPSEHPARSLFRVEPEQDEHNSPLINKPEIDVTESLPVEREVIAQAAEKVSASSSPEDIAALPLLPRPSSEARASQSFESFLAQWKDPLHLHKGEIKVLEVLFSETHDTGTVEFHTTQAKLAERAQLKKRQCQNVVASLMKRGLIDKVDLQNKGNNRGLIIRVYLSPHPPTSNS